MAVSPNTPAFGTGNAHASGLPATDQRGLPRVVGGQLDLGAFENQRVLSSVGSLTSSLVSQSVLGMMRLNVPPSGMAAMNLPAPLDLVFAANSSVWPDSLTAPARISVQHSSAALPAPNGSSPEALLLAVDEAGLADAILSDGAAWLQHVAVNPQPLPPRI
jgi:hypothetical protein